MVQKETLMKQRYFLLLFMLTLGALLISCTQDNSTTPPPNNTVLIKDNFFDPGTLTVAVGRPVVWKHEGNGTHTVTSGTPTVNPGVIFDSGALNPGGGFQFTFSTPGSYSYFCRVHGINMTGTITVQ
jgi:plastocyanin